MKYSQDLKRIKQAAKKPAPVNKRIIKRITRFLSQIFALALLVLAGMVTFPSNLRDSFENTIQETLSKLDLKVQHIEVSGNDRLDEQAILTIAGNSIGDNIILVPIEEIKNRLEKEPWIYKATVVRRIPSTIKIEIVEEYPEAIYIVNNTQFLITKTGKILDKVADQNEENGYIKVKGNGANILYRAVLSQIDTNRDITERLQIMELISQRRWNLTLKSQAIIKLPEADIIEALEALNKIQNKNKILDIPAILDLRLAPDKIYIRLP